MAANNLNLEYISRQPANSDEDKLIFKPGVNIIVGEKDTGKTKWLRMFDFLMGSDKSAKDGFGADLAEKYDSVSALLKIGDAEVLIERKWKERGFSSEIFINGEAIPQTEFSSIILKKLNFPILHYPKGNPFAERAWPELSLRSLFRHIYRREDLWSDFADKQYDVEQHACISMFVGIAEKLFPEQYGDFIKKQKKMSVLEEMKDQFMSMLHEVSNELVVSKSVSVSVTADSIDSSIRNLHEQIDELYSKRNDLLENLKNEQLKRESNTEKLSEDQFTIISKKILKLNDQKAEIQYRLNEANKRLSELREYYKIVSDEESRLKRVQSAGNLLGHIKSTFCPVCDRIIQDNNNSKNCYLCGRPYSENEDAINTGNARVEFDLNQLKAERLELNQLIGDLEIEEIQHINTLRELETEVQRLESRLRPLKIAASAILPEEIGLIDQDIGGLEEQVLQLGRIKSALKKRENISSEIDKIEKEAAEIKSQHEKLNAEINFARVSDKITDGMNTYLNELNVNDQKRWQRGPVSFKLRKRSFDAFISGNDWKAALGATSKVLFLMAYHYSLLNLSNNELYYYPGFLILDFPVQLADGSSIADKENYLIQPFTKLLSKEKMSNTQMIAAGRAFESLKGANRVELHTVWT